MLGIGGKFASSKGMVAVPNLSGLTRQEAKDAIASAGLRFSGETEISNSSGSSSNGKATNQSVAAGTLIDYESPISFEYFGTYVDPVYVTKTEENCTQNNRYVYLDFLGFSYGPCVNKTKTVTSSRSYQLWVSQTCTTKTYYSDGTTYTSPSYTYPEQYVGDVVLTRSEPSQAC